MTPIYMSAVVRSSLSDESHENAKIDAWRSDTPESLN